MKDKMKLVTTTAVFLMFAMLGARGFAGDSAGSRLGVGVNYWVSLDELDSDVDDDGFSYLLTYKYHSEGLLGFQLDFEMLPDRFGEDAYAPAGYVILGKGLYVAAGVGIVNTDGDWANDPFFAFRAGLDFALTSKVFLDIGASYRFDSELDLGDAVDAIDTDTVFLGAAVRLAL